MSKIRNPSLMVPSAAAFARASINQIGEHARTLGSRASRGRCLSCHRSGREATILPYWAHDLQFKLTTVRFPRASPARFTRARARCRCCPVSHC
jgi:hypothetical protein